MTGHEDTGFDPEILDRVGVECSKILRENKQRILDAAGGYFAEANTGVFVAHSTDGDFERIKVEAITFLYNDKDD